MNVDDEAAIITSIFRAQIVRVRDGLFGRRSVADQFAYSQYMTGELATAHGCVSGLDTDHVTAQP